MECDKTKKIVVVVSGLEEEYQFNIFRGINHFAYEHNMNISYVAGFAGMVGSNSFDIGESSIYNLIDYSQFDGALLMTNTFGDPDMRNRIFNKVLAANIPAAVFESREHPEFYDISIDNFDVMKKLVNHVIQFHGAKTINYVSGPLGNPEGKARYEAFISAMQENELTVEPERVYYGEFKSHDGKLAVEAFTSSGLPLPDAFICANDSMALTVASSLIKLGYTIPDDVIVTGFDNTFSARNATPSITSVKRPLFLAGEKAAMMISNVIDGVSQERSTILDAEPSYSESCGCKNCSNDDEKKYKRITYRKIEDNNSNIHILNRLNAGLAEATTPSEYFHVIAEIIGELECEKFCLCLCEDWQECIDASNDEYPAYMFAPLILDKGERRSISYFPSKNMFPEGFDERASVNYFLPLHYGNQCFGYYIFTNSDFPTCSLLCHTLSMMLSNSLENIRKLTHLNKAMSELNRLYVMDPLCNIYNRNGFINIADDMFKECVAKGSQVMISFIDMDGLKFINDNYGHNEGDFAIQRIASIIHNCCDGDAVCARFGGDEFVYFSPDAALSDPINLSRRINIALDNINNLIQKPYTISASIGSIVTIAKPGDTLYSIIKLADEKMYDVKRLKSTTRKSEKI